MSRNLWTILIVSLLLPFGAAKADTLEMNDGALVEGKFMGGTRNSIRSKVDEQLMIYPAGDVPAITFTLSAVGAAIGAGAEKYDGLHQSSIWKRLRKGASRW